MPRARRRSSGKQKAKKTSKAPVRPCTYPLGYVRQDLYACMTCTANASGIRSGFCRGCRETCHSKPGCMVLELYTKRAFRCDCGNTRAKNSCKLYPDKDCVNESNDYNHNFNSRYCRCDTEYDYRLNMIQCCMCEDWFHGSCFISDNEVRGAGSVEEVFNSEFEFTCKDCVATLPVLAEYYDLLNVWDGGSVPKGKRRNKYGELCMRPGKGTESTVAGQLDYIWRPKWRLQLCRCSECNDMYVECGAGYIADPKDFVGAQVEEDVLMLSATDAQIAQDVLREEHEARQQDIGQMDVDLGDRIPRKAPEGSVVIQGGVVRPDELKEIRARIRKFLQQTIASNGGTLKADSLELYLNDLKADMLCSGS